MIRKTPQDQRFHDHPEEAVTKKLESKKRQYYNISQKRRNYMQSYLDNQIWTCNSSIPFLFFIWKRIFLKKKSTKVQTKSVYFSAYFTRKEFILELASFGLCTKITKVKITWLLWVLLKTRTEQHILQVNKSFTIRTHSTRVCFATAYMDWNTLFSPLSYVDFYGPFLQEMYPYT